MQAPVDADGGKAGLVTYPVFAFDPEDPTFVTVVGALEDAGGREIEYFDVRDESFVFWDSRGERVQATIDEGASHRLKLAATGMMDMPGLGEAICRYAKAEGVPGPGLEGLAPSEALGHIERAVEERLPAVRGKRRRYEFWRSG
jgi:hypothetical protein